MTIQQTPSRIRQILSDLIDPQNPDKQIESLLFLESLYHTDSSKIDTIFSLIPLSEWETVLLKSNFNVQKNAVRFAQTIFQNKGGLSFNTEILIGVYELYDTSNDGEITRICVEAIEIFVDNLTQVEGLEGMLRVIPRLRNMYLKHQISCIYVKCLEYFDFDLEELDFHKTFSLFKEQNH